MGAQEPVDPQIVVNYGSRTTSAAEPEIEEPEDAEEGAEDCDAWEQAIFDAVPRRKVGNQQGG